MDYEYSHVTEVDDKGVSFMLSACDMAYTYDTNGKLKTQTATHLDGTVRVKTFTYTSGLLTGETKWVKQ